MDAFRPFGSVVQNHATNFKKSLFIPIPEVFRPDGNILLIFLIGNGIRFFEPTEDAWYRATVPGYEMMDTSRGQTRVAYWPEESASPLGCVEQVQFCNTALAPDERCGPLTDWDDAVLESAILFNATAQQLEDWEPVAADSTASQFIWLTVLVNNAAADLTKLLKTLGPESLASKANLAQGIMGPLALNQWQLDVTQWWSTYLASLQAAFVQTAIGPADPTGELEQFKLGPWNDHSRKLCNNQVRKTFHELRYPLNGLTSHVWPPKF